MVCNYVSRLLVLIECFGQVCVVGMSVVIYKVCLVVVWVCLMFLIVCVEVLFSQVVEVEMCGVQVESVVLVVQQIVCLVCIWMLVSLGINVMVQEYFEVVICVVDVVFVLIVENGK